MEKCDLCAVVVRRKIMERGSSVPWQETLQEAIGEDRLDATALREYFRPLEDWLRTENLRTGDVVGWSYGKNSFIFWFFNLYLHHSSYFHHLQRVICKCVALWNVEDINQILAILFF